MDRKFAVCLEQELNDTKRELTELQQLVKMQNSQLIEWLLTKRQEAKSAIAATTFTTVIEYLENR